MDEDIFKAIRCGVVLAKGCKKSEVTMDTDLTSCTHDEMSIILLEILSRLGTGFTERTKEMTTVGKLAEMIKEECIY